MNDILEQALEQQLKQQQTEKAIRMIHEPVFNKSKDKIGLPMEHVAYANKKCRECNGKGWNIRHYPYFVTITPEIGSSSFYSICDCVHKGYSKTRIKIEALMEKGLSLKQAAERIRFNALE